MEKIKLLVADGIRGNFETLEALDSIKASYIQRLGIRQNYDIID